MSEKQVLRVMRRFGVIAVYQGMNLSRACKKKQEIPVSAERKSHPLPESGLVDGHNIYPSVVRQCISYGGNRLVFA